MNARTLATRLFALARKTCGLGLILTCCAGVAFATPPLPGGTPEIDPGSAMTALGLLTGGLLMLTDRLRRR